MPQINTILLVRLRGLIAQGARFGQYSIWPFVRNIVRPNRDINLEPWIEVITQNLLNFTLGTEHFGWVISEFDRDKLTRFRAAL